MESVKKLRLGDKTIPIIIAIVAVVIVGIIAAVVHDKQDKVETQRTARVVEVNGPCSILREGATINAIADMPLYSGDTFFSGVNASARIMVDDDKFLYLDAATRINFTASGTPGDTHTMIYIETGSLLTEVKEKLAEGETFDIVTPNTSTAIHGTIPIHTVAEDWEGNITTNIAFAEGEGTVSVFERNSNGVVSITDMNMSAQEGASFTTGGDLILGVQDAQALLETGKTEDGKVAQNTTLDNLQTVSGEASFDGRFLDNAQAATQRNTQDYINNNNLDSGSATYQQENLATVRANGIIDEFREGEAKIPVTVAVAQSALSESEPVADVTSADQVAPTPDQTPEPEPESEPAQETEPSADPEPATTAVNNNNQDNIIYVDGKPLTPEEQIQAIYDALALIQANQNQMDANNLAGQQPSQPPSEPGDQGGQDSGDDQTPQQSDSSPSQSTGTTPSPSPSNIPSTTPSPSPGNSPSTTPSPSPGSSPSTDPSTSPGSSPSPTPDQTSDTHPSPDVSPSAGTSPSPDSSDNTESTYEPTAIPTRPGANGSFDPLEPFEPEKPDVPPSDSGDETTPVVQSDDEGAYVIVEGERYSVYITGDGRGPYYEINGDRVYLEDPDSSDSHSSPDPSPS